MIFSISIQFCNPIAKLYRLTELGMRAETTITKQASWACFVRVGAEGFEPPTIGLKGRCSTD